MPGFALRLFVDDMAANATLELAAGPHRVLYVAAGAIGLDAAGVAWLAADSAWHGNSAAALRAGAAGARLLRCELISGEGNERGALLHAPVVLDASQPWLMRCDRVEFPPGGVAYTHTHRGPGIRCLQLGSIRIDTAGGSHSYAPGQAWFESGPDPVFAAGSLTEPTAFIRVMILPREFLGRSSIRYVKPEDQDKPKPQSYKMYIDTPIELRGS
jgi:hypothetical protein